MTMMCGGLVYPLLNPCHNVMGKTGLVVVTVQGAGGQFLCTFNGGGTRGGGLGFQEPGLGS